MEEVVEFLKRLPLLSGARVGICTQIGQRLVFRYGETRSFARHGACGLTPDRTVHKSQHVLHQGEKDSTFLWIMYKGEAEAECYRYGSGLKASTLNGPEREYEMGCNVRSR